MASHEVVLVAIYFASEELRATTFCFLLHQEVILDPNVETVTRGAFPIH